MNMFNGSVSNPFPRNANECNKEDPVASSLWKWARILETIGIVLFVVDLIGGLIAAIALAEAWDAVSLVFIPGGALVGALVYLAFHISALLFGSLGRITQNTTVSASVDLLNLSISAPSESACDQTALKVESNNKVDNAVSTDKPRKKVNNIFLGKYRQSNDDSSSKESIDWLVLKNEGGKALIISKYALDCKPFNDTPADVKWDNCSLRKWLNEDFYNGAFDQSEKERIIQSDGIPSKDRVFLINNLEYKEHLDDEIGKCVPTEYAINKGVAVSASSSVDGKATCWWWLRSPGDDPQNTAIVTTKGILNAGGSKSCKKNVAVRPAMWINLGD